MSQHDLHPGLIPEIRYDHMMEPVITYRPSLLGKAFNPKSTGNVLVIRWGGIGDLIMLSPSLKALKAKYPDMAITLASKWPLILKDMPYLERSIPIEEAVTSAYDSVIDLRMMVESAGMGGLLPDVLYKSVNRMEMFARLMGVDDADFSADVYLDRSRIPEVKRLVNFEEGFRHVGIQMTCTSNLRTIPPDYLPQLIELLSGLDHTRIVLFGRLERWHGRNPRLDLLTIGGEKAINLMEKVPLPDLAPLISLMDLVIAPDSSAIHIAGALRVRCLALFGNIHPYLRTVHYKSVTNLYPEGELDCVPCYDLTNPCLFYKDIPTPEQPIGAECMRRLTPERIFQKTKEILEA